METNFTAQIENEVVRAFNSICEIKNDFSDYCKEYKYDTIKTLVTYAFNNKESIEPSKFDYKKYIGKYGVIFCDTRKSSNLFDEELIVKAIINTNVL